MGVSTDAILFYGFTIDGDLRDFYNDCTFSWEEDQDEYIASIFDLHSENGNPDWDRIESLDCMIGTHCSMSSPEFFIAVTESVVTARRGYPERVGGLDPIQPAYDSYLKEFCEKIGIPYQNPNWYIASFWEQ